MHEFVVPRSMPMVLAMIAGVLLVGTDCEKSASCYSRSFSPIPGKQARHAVSIKEEKHGWTPAGPWTGTRTPGPHHTAGRPGRARVRPRPRPRPALRTRPGL